MKIKLCNCLWGLLHGFYFKNCIIYLFIYSIDATEDASHMARMVNDIHKQGANSKMVVVPVDGKPHLCLFAVGNISAGTQLQYDYGDDNLPWRKKVLIIKHKTPISLIFWNL